MNYSNLIVEAMQSGAKATGYNFDATNEYLKAHSGDRRYRLYALAGTASWGYNENGVVQYRKRAYRYRQNKTGYDVQLESNYPREYLY